MKIKTFQKSRLLFPEINLELNRDVCHYKVSQRYSAGRPPHQEISTGNLGSREPQLEVRQHAGLHIQSQRFV